MRNLKLKWAPSKSPDVSSQELVVVKRTADGQKTNYGPVVLQPTVDSFGLGPEYKNTPSGLTIQTGDQLDVVLVSIGADGNRSRPLVMSVKVPAPKPLPPSNLEVEAD